MTDEERSDHTIRHNYKTFSQSPCQQMTRQKNRIYDYLLKIKMQLKKREVRKNRNDLIA